MISLGNNIAIDKQEVIIFDPDVEGQRIDYLQAKQNWWSYDEPVAESSSRSLEVAPYPEVFIGGSWYDIISVKNETWVNQIGTEFEIIKSMTLSKPYDKGAANVDMLIRRDEKCASGYKSNLCNRCEGNFSKKGKGEQNQFNFKILNFPVGKRRRPTRGRHMFA